MQLGVEIYGFEIIKKLIHHDLQLTAIPDP